MRRLSLLILILCMTSALPIVRAQPPDGEPILAELNHIREEKHAQPALQQDMKLNKLAGILVEQIEDDCTFFMSDNDRSYAEQVGYSASFEVVRLCGVNLDNAEVIQQFAQETDSETGVPLIGQPKYEAFGIATQQRQTASGNPQTRYVLVLGEESTSPAAIESASPSFSLEATFQSDLLSFAFNYPVSWTTQHDPDGGITIASTEEDLGPASDGNPSTKAQGPFITLDAIPLQALGVPMDVALEDIEKTIIDILELRVDDRFEVPVIARRAVTLMGEDGNGDYGLVTFWLQRNQLALFVLSAPTPDSAKSWTDEWKQILSSAKHTNTLPLTQTAASELLTELIIDYPQGWTEYSGVDANAQELFLIAERKSDIDALVAGVGGFQSGITISASYNPTAVLVERGFITSEDLDELQDFYRRVSGMSFTRVREGVVFGEPARLVRGNDPNGFWGYGVMGFVDDNAYFVLFSAPNEQTLNEFIPTFHNMIKRFRRG